MAIPSLDKSIKVAEVHRGEEYDAVQLEGLILVTCYVSRNIDMLSYQEVVNMVRLELGNGGGEHIFVGDINTKSTIWGSPRTARKANSLREFGRP